MKALELAKENEAKSKKDGKLRKYIHGMIEYCAYNLNKREVLYKDGWNFHCELRDSFFKNKINDGDLIAVAIISSTVTIKKHWFTSEVFLKYINPITKEKVIVKNPTWGGTGNGCP